MKRPQPAPAPDPSRLTPEVLMLALIAAAAEDREPYLHWDALRRRSPPDGLDHEAWWIGISLRRQAAGRTLPLQSKDGRALWLASSDHFLRDLHHIDQRLVGRVGSPDRDDPSAGTVAYARAAAEEEAIASSQLEGASTTRRVAKALLRSGRAPSNDSERMIVNNHRALQRVREQRDAPLTLELLLEIHRLATQGTLKDPDDEGRLRQTDDVHVTESLDGEILHIPPPASAVTERLGTLLRFANDTGETEPFVHPVLRAIAVHYQLAYEHPFVDGNGRTARVVFLWCLLHHGYWLAEHVALSRILKQAPTAYARAFLYTQTAHNDLTYFALHQIRALRQAIQALDDWIAHQAARNRRARDHLRNRPELNPRQTAVIDHALRHPDAAYVIAQHQGYHHVAYPTARQDLLDLAADGLLLQRKHGKKWVFLVPDDLRERLDVPTPTP